ncbi:MAG TPA: hypothetical protein VFT16_00740 [Candidatus Saccharimonadales bacterium]|nr:hypothetical protein [Candidatus Saccharimonadales bacterium]
MLKTSATSPVKKRMGTNKFVLGFAALAASAIVGTTGIAAAHSTPPNGGGYGYGGTSVNLDLNVNGSNNVINIIIRLFQ